MILLGVLIAVTLVSLEQVGRRLYLRRISRRNPSAWRGFYK